MSHRASCRAHVLVLLALRALSCYLLCMCSRALPDPHALSCYLLCICSCAYFCACSRATYSACTIAHCSACALVCLALRVCVLIHNKAGGFTGRTLRNAFRRSTNSYVTFCSKALHSAGGKEGQQHRQRPAPIPGDGIQQRQPRSVPRAKGAP